MKNKNSIILVSALCSLISVSTFAEDRIAKEYTTPPPAEEALPLSAIPQQFLPKPAVKPVTQADTTPAASAAD